jgi:hypothetical protein
MRRQSRLGARRIAKVSAIRPRRGRQLVSDTSQGPGWWQASDGKWYPPEQAPGYQPPADGGAAAGGAGGPVTFELGAAIGYGWNKFIQYIGQIILIVLIIFAVEIVFNVVVGAFAGAIGGLAGLAFRLLFLAVGFFVAFMLQAGLIRASLAVTRGEAPEPSMLFETDRLGQFAGAAIIVAALSFVGFFVCCIGYFVVAIFTLFFGFYVLDKNQGATESIGSSYNLVKDNAGQVILFAILVVVLNLITCGLAIGVTSIAMAYAFKTLNGEAVAA